MLPYQIQNLEKIQKHLDQLKTDIKDSKSEDKKFQGKRLKRVLKLKVKSLRPKR